MLELTARMVREFYAGDMSLLAQYAAPNMVWMGAMENQYSENMKLVRRLLKSEAPILRTVDWERYRLTLANDDCCVVTGQVQISTDPSTHMLLAARQRITLVYELRRGRPVLVHLHLSIPWEASAREKGFPYRAGRQTYEYVQQVLRQKHRAPPRLIVHDAHRNTHILLEDEIFFLEAQGASVLFHCLNGCLRLRGSLTEWAARLPGRFIRAHRSYIVNPDYVTGYKRFQLQMCDGQVVPVPEKQYTKVCAQIEKQVIRLEKQVIDDASIESENQER